MASPFPGADFWSIKLRDRLQAILDKVYDDGGFAYLIDDTSPDPPLDDEDSSWAQKLSSVGAT